ncbi:MAG: hypothetical protein ACREIA_09915, partial [Opitutaceae bacterium]
PTPAQYRVVVRSAAEAVAMVSERFGDAARVLSVRQIEAGGLARFLQKPRLEVIVEVGAAPMRLEAASDEDASPHDEEIAEAENASEFPDDEPKAAQPPAPEPLPHAQRAPSTREISLLRATGLDELILERVRAENEGLDWSRARAPEALGRVGAWLRRQFELLPKRPCSARRVFIGPCGAGKTSALCKLLAHDVFVNGIQGAVLKLDGENPNATDGLAAFCDVLGAPLLRSASEVREFDSESLIYIDLPGIALDAVAEHRRLAQTLDALDVETRVLVINAGWETELIADAYDMGRARGATHVFFSHLEEARRPGKLWRFALFGGLRPLACSTGPSPAGEMEQDVFNALLARTVPASVARAAGHEGGRS